MTREARVRAAAAGAGIATLALGVSGCIVGQQTLEGELDRAAGDTAEVDLWALHPNATQMAIACPYSGAAASEVFGQPVLGNYADVNESTNWVVAKLRGGALLKEELSRSAIDLCSAAGTGGVEGVREIQEGELLQLERTNGQWVLAAITRP